MWLGDTPFPVDTLYGADGTAYALANVPLGVAATYYTKAEYVPHARAAYAPQGDPAGGDDAEASAPEALAA